MRFLGDAFFVLVFSTQAGLAFAQVVSTCAIGDAVAFGIDAVATKSAAGTRDTGRHIETRLAVVGT